MRKDDFIDTEKRTAGENARAFIVTLCIGFTIIMVTCMTLGTIFLDEQNRQGLQYAWSILGGCLAAAVLQFLFFTPTVIKHMTYPLRLTAFGICLYAVLAIIGVIMRWFPSESIGAWMGFTLIYLAVFAATAAVYACMWRHQSRELNQGLARYRKNSK
jgi:hypothetical protein